MLQGEIAPKVAVNTQDVQNAQHLFIFIFNNERMEDSLEEKKAFFDELAALDDESTESEVDDEIAVVLQSSRKRAIAPVTPEGVLTSSSRPVHNPRRAVSSPVPQSTSTSERDAVTLVKDTPRLPRAISFQSVIVPDSTTKTSTDFKKRGPKVTGKRKRGDSPNYLPEAQQLFRGQSFCKFLSATNIVSDLSSMQISSRITISLLPGSFALKRPLNGALYGSKSGGRM